MTESKQSLLERKLKRELAARKEAEAILEAKSRQLYQVNKNLVLKSKQLALAVQKLKEAQGNLVQSEKLASLGTVAAGIAHEINNPLGWIIGNITIISEYTEVLLELNQLYREFSETLPEETKENETLRRIRELESKEDISFVREDITKALFQSLKGADHVSKIVKGLGAFSRKNDGKISSISANNCVEMSRDLVNSEAKQKCELKFDLDPNVPDALGNETELTQVIVNLIVNSIHAIEKTPSPSIVVSTHKQKGKIQIKVKDNGCGISEENQKKIFDPFFTTKGVGKGTGLGLSLSKGLIEKMKGKLNVQSKEHMGTCFTIDLCEA